MTDPALLGRLRILEGKLDLLTQAIKDLAAALRERQEEPKAPK